MATTGNLGDNFRKYGVPIYGAGWAPQPHLLNSGEGSSSASEHLVLSGGGGVGNTGIRNAILLARFDSSANSLSSDPVARHGTEDDLPYRMAVHPKGDGIVCGFDESCRWFDWDKQENGDLGVKLSDKVLTPLVDVGQQLGLAFSEDGSLLAAGGQDGKLKVFKWPSMEIILNEEKPYASIRDIHFSIDGRYLVSLGRGGPCRVWDVTTATAVASLPNENDGGTGLTLGQKDQTPHGEDFRFCRFSQSSMGEQVLFIAAGQGKGVSIISWNTVSWKRVASKKFRCSITAFNVSVDGTLLAIGTDGGDILIIDSSNMRVRMTLKKAHLGLVTALTFSRDSRALGSASMDSSVRVTLVQANTTKGSNYWMIILFIILAIVAYFLESKGMILRRPAFPLV